MTAPNCDRVRIHVQSDESARRVAAVLGSLGYEVVRDLSEHEGDLFAEVADVAARRYRLTTREHEILVALLRGAARDELAASLGVTQATVKWHLHNLYVKLGVDGSEQALRKVMRLDDLRWLREPRRQRDALELLELAADETLAAMRSELPQRIEAAGHKLEQTLQEARTLAGLRRDNTAT